MSKSKAIGILEEYIRFKEFCVNNMNKNRYKTDIEDIRKQIVDLHTRDKKLLEVILFELISDKPVTKGKNSSKKDLLSLELKREIARQVKLGIANYKKNSEKVRIRDSKREN